MKSIRLDNIWLVTGDSTKVATGSADSSLRLWDCETGKCLETYKTKTSVRTSLFGYSGKLLLFSTDDLMGITPEINIIDVTSGEQIIEFNPLKIAKEGSESKVLASLWGLADETFVTGDESGNIIQWDMRNYEIIKEVKVHSNQINDLQYNADQTMFVSASKDKTAKVRLIHFVTCNTIPFFC